MLIEETYVIPFGSITLDELESMFNWFENNAEGNSSMTYDYGNRIVFSTNFISSFQPPSPATKVRLRFNSMIEKNYFRLCFADKIEKFLVATSLQT